MAKNKQWYIDKYGEADGLARHEAIRQKTCANSRGKNTLSGFISRYGESIGTERYNEFCAKSKHTKAKYISTHGEIVGTQLWDDYVIKKAFTSKRRPEYWIARGCSPDEAHNLVKHHQTNTTIDRFIDQYGDVEGTLRYVEHYANHSRMLTLAGFVERYGEIEGTLRYNNHVSSRCQKLERYIHRYGVDDGTKRWKAVCESKAKNLSNYIKWYGEDEGLNRWKNQYTIKSLVSKSSIRYFLPLYRALRKVGMRKSDIYWGISGSTEYFIRDDDKLFWYDFTIPLHKIIIEYNGEHVHPNPSMAASEQANWKHAFSGKGFNECMEHDHRKRLAAERLGYTIIYVWSQNETPITNIMEQINDLIKR